MLVSFPLVSVWQWCARACHTLAIGGAGSCLSSNDVLMYPSFVSVLLVVSIIRSFSSGVCGGVYGGVYGGVCMHKPVKNY